MRVSYSGSLCQSSGSLCPSSGLSLSSLWIRLILTCSGSCVVPADRSSLPGLSAIENWLLVSKCPIDLGCLKPNRIREIRQIVPALPLPHNALSRSSRFLICWPAFLCRVPCAASQSLSALSHGWHHTCMHSSGAEPDEWCLPSSSIPCIMMPAMSRDAAPTIGDPSEGPQGVIAQYESEGPSRTRIIFLGLTLASPLI